MEEHTSPPQKKLRIGWFSFTCCEDSTVIMTEILNDYFFEWKPLLDIRHAKVLQARNTWDQMDVAFVEGAISSDAQAEKLKKIRELSTKVVAIGACAITALPAGQRNFFDEKTKEEIKPMMERFNYSERVLRLNEVVTVDAIVPGCPMIPNKFIELINQMFIEFSVRSGQQGSAQPS